MAGCEYLPNIERVGLKVALKHFDKIKSFTGVLKFLRENKPTMDKVPENYEDKVHRVIQLFKYQTVYDPRDQCLT